MVSWKVPTYQIGIAVAELAGRPGYAPMTHFSHATPKLPRINKERGRTL